MEQAQHRLETEDAAQTQAVAERLAAVLAPGDVLALSGDLGTGKTTFVQGLARGLGVSGRVTSPTFVLINRYRAAHGRILQHADCYRLKDAPLEMWDAGLGDLVAAGDDDLVVIEWADRIPDLLPEDRLDIAFEYLDENRRRITFSAHGARYRELLERCFWP
jgi:tRNA threonylcarbamoyladenosine biosynthesis protein TsaE